MTDTQKLVLGEYGPRGWLKCRAPLAALDTHMYVVGKTKKGKSKFLQHLAYQLIALGQGCGLLDPHGDLADDLLTHLAPHLAPLLEQEALRKRIIYLDPSRRDWALPFNVLHTPSEPYRVAQNVLEAFRRAWPESLREAPRFANIVLAATMVLIENKLTLAEMPRLLTDYTYRDMLLRQVTNPEVTRFFRTRYDRWGREQALIVESALNKVGALVINPQLRLILGQRENALPFRRLMDEGRVLICDLGRTDGETRRLLGSLIVTGFEQAALTRQGHAAARATPLFPAAGRIPGILGAGRLGANAGADPLRMSQVRAAPDSGAPTPGPGERWPARRAGERAAQGDLWRRAGDGAGARGRVVPPGADDRGGEKAGAGGAVGALYPGGAAAESARGASATAGAGRAKASAHVSRAGSGVGPEGVGVTEEGIGQTVGEKRCDNQTGAGSRRKGERHRRL